MSISYSSTIDHINEQLITWVCFLSVNLYHISFLSLCLASTTGGLLSSIGLSGLLAGSIRTVAPFMPVTSFRRAVKVQLLLCVTYQGGGCSGISHGQLRFSSVVEQSQQGISLQVVLHLLFLLSGSVEYPMPYIYCLASCSVGWRLSCCLVVP